jgi:hypothetical protein
MNFNQWQKYAAKNDVARVTYCCGNEETLVELVVSDIKRILDVDATNYINIDLPKSAPLWELASQYPLDPKANRLVVVRNAEQFDDWTGLTDWVANARINPRNYIVFVSYASDAPAIFVRGKKQSYVDYIELIRTKGKFIKCSTPNDEDLMLYIQSSGLSKLSAEFLIERTSGDVNAIFDVLKKIDVWNGSPTPKALSLLCEEQALDSFADYLILRDKRSAYLSLTNMSEEDKSKIISRLDYRLDTLMEIGRCVRRRMFDGDIAAATGVKIYLIKRFKSVVKDYDDRKIRYCRQLLTMIDGIQRDGANTGTWEALITLW